MAKKQSPTKQRSSKKKTGFPFIVRDKLKVDVFYDDNDMRKYAKEIGAHESDIYFGEVK